MEKTTTLRKRIAHLKAGQAPGNLRYYGDRQKLGKARIRVCDYNEQQLKERTIERVSESADYYLTPSCTWISFEGLYDTPSFEEIGAIFHIHPLTLEDILEYGQRSKIDDYDEYLFFIANIAYLNTDGDIQYESLSLILNESMVISFQEDQADFFDSVRERIRHSRGRIRRKGADYLAYALLDAVVDNYSIVLEHIEEQIELINNEIFETNSESLVRNIHSLMQHVLALHHTMGPLKDALSTLLRADEHLITSSTKIYMKDLHDHTLAVSAAIQNSRDILTTLLEVHMTVASHRINETMKVLTSLSLLFIPATFIAGVYGMNFNNMPELRWHYGYLYVWIFFLLIFAGTYLYLRKKRML